MTDQLYPTIIADNLSHAPATQDNSTLCNQITSELDQYLHEATERCENQDNYFEGCHRSTNTSSVQQEDLHYQEEISSSHLNPEITGTPESQEGDTGIHQLSTNTSQHNSQPDQFSTISEEDNDEVDPAEDTLVFNSESDQSDNDLFDTAMDTTSDDPIITMGKPLTAALISNLVHVPTEQVGCLLVTKSLQ